MNSPIDNRSDAPPPAVSTRDQQTRAMVVWGAIAAVSLYGGAAPAMVGGQHTGATVAINRLVQGAADALAGRGGDHDAADDFDRAGETIRIGCTSIYSGLMSYHD